MYSKSQGYHTRPSVPLRREPERGDPRYGEGNRGPSYRQRVRVPPNYSGHAIVDGEERVFEAVPVLPEEAPTSPELPRLTPPEPHFDDLPRVSELGARATATPGLSALPVAPPEAGQPTSSEDSEPDSASVPATRPLPFLDPSHFPFGHGIGSDELLLLGLIVFLLYENARSGSGRGDLDETVILLGILLLCG